MDRIDRARQTDWKEINQTDYEIQIDLHNPKGGGLANPMMNSDGDIDMQWGAQESTATTVATCTLS